MRTICTVAAVVFVCLANSVLAQEMRGTVRDSATRRPIAGAVLVLLDSSGGVLSRNITNDRGVYRISLSRRIRRMRALHIGFRPRDVRVPAIDSGVVQLDVTMVVLPTLLEPVHVTDRSNCPRRDDRAAAFALWEQARTALLATVVAREANPASFVRLGFDRLMKDGGDEIVRQSVRIDTVASTGAFVALRHASEFIRRGFLTDSGGRESYSGPDADVLLDDAFAGGYCFHIAPPDRARPHEIGLGFVAADRKRGRVDIEGAVWVDSTTRSLTQISYRYVGVNSRVARFAPDGRISFRSMDNGTVIIDRWFIRVPVPDSAGFATAGPTSRIFLETHEIGGEVAFATWPDGRTWRNPLGALRGRVAVENPAGSVVRLMGTPYQATADSAGLFEIPELLPGPYTIGVVDPRLADAGIHLRTGLGFTAVRDSTITVLVEIPSAEQYMAALCEGERAPQGAAILAARVALPDGTPAAGARVTVRLLKGGDGSRVADGKADRDGLFRFCQAPHNSTLEIRAERPGGAPAIGVIEINGNLVTIVLQFKNAPPR